MNRLTRTHPLVNSSELRLFISPRRRNPNPRSLAGEFSSTVQIKPTHTQSSSPKTNLTAAFNAAAGRRRPDQISPAMDSAAAAAAAAKEDFVRIDGPDSSTRENPSPDIESLVQSISSVDGERGDAREEDEGSERKALPEELWRSVMKLSCESSAEGGICNVYLVGTAHVSQIVLNNKFKFADLSWRSVDVPNRSGCFLGTMFKSTGGTYSSEFKADLLFRLHIPTNQKKWDLNRFPQAFKISGLLPLLAGIGNYKAHPGWSARGHLDAQVRGQVASKLEVFPGAEFRVAFEEAVKYGGKVILGDRPVQITLRRTWAKMPLWHKTKLLYSLVFQAFFLPSPEDLNKMLKQMDDVDMLTLVIQEMSKEFPTLMETLVHERDQYMSSALLRVASESGSVVAVVGKGHLQGIKKYWKQPVEVQDLMHVDLPSQKPAISAVKILTSLGVTVAGVAIISGIYLSTKR
ncbi:TraB family protein [Actinidia rufa]|uniref:TraB family protein n=1 Tax=Actinidia rufa TaxID=165716 RepID=A0A7J0FKB3_9ERIC|nr:TraB family protein [Actinidia rufa]